jgi:Tfp pilus assembly protein PilF
VDKLREFFAKRKITVGASGLAVLITANAVQAAPAGLIATISATALAGTAVTTSTAIAAAKTIAMTTLQKSLVTVTVAVLAGAGIYEARQAAQLRDQVETLHLQQAPLAERVRQLQAEREMATHTIAWQKQELAQNEKNNSELLKLRGEIGMVRNQLADAKNTNKPTEQPSLATAREYLSRARQHSMNHEYEAQLDDLNHAVELDSTLAEAFMERGNLYSMNLPKERGGEKQAVADYTRCLEIKPNDASARWNRATYYVQLRQYDEAIADWTIYITGDTDFSHELEGKTKSIAGAYLWRGHTFQMYLHDYSKAIADYSAAMQLNQNIEDAHRLRGQCYESLGETEKAQQDFAIEPKHN